MVKAIEAAQVAAKWAMESLYTGTCTVIEYQSYTKPNKSTGKHEVQVLINQPCKLSYSKVTNVVNGDSASAIVQIVKLFISPEIQIKPGSKITVTHEGRTSDFKNSGEPAIYTTHQEIVLELFKGWA